MLEGSIRSGERQQNPTHEEEGGGGGELYIFLMRFDTSEPSHTSRTLVQYRSEHPSRSILFSVDLPFPLPQLPSRLRSFLYDSHAIKLSTPS